MFSKYILLFVFISSCLSYRYARSAYFTPRDHFFSNWHNSWGSAAPYDPYHDHYWTSTSSYHNSYYGPYSTSSYYPSFHPTPSYSHDPTSYQGSTRSSYSRPQLPTMGYPSTENYPDAGWHGPSQQPPIARPTGNYPQDGSDHTWGGSSQQPPVPTGNYPQDGSDHTWAGSSQQPPVPTGNYPHDGSDQGWGGSSQQPPIPTENSPQDGSNPTWDGSSQSSQGGAPLPPDGSNPSGPTDHQQPTDQMPFGSGPPAPPSDDYIDSHTQTRIEPTQQMIEPTRKVRHGPPGTMLPPQASVPEIPMPPTN